MSFEIMKKTMIGVVGAVALMGAAASQAATIDPGAGSYVFEGDNVQLTKNFLGFPVTITCNVALYGNVSENSNGDVVIQVTAGSIPSGSSSQCSNVSLNFSNPWYATEQTSTPPASPGYIPDADLPTTSNPNTDVTGQFNDVSVSTPIGDCSGSINVVYNNEGSNPSQFSFSNASLGSGCSLSGTFKATSSFGGFSSDGGASDVNVYQ